jgi:acyl-CoA synthetase (AMP-forming)/AMP-acid ligase II
LEFNLADCFECVADTVPDRLAVVAGDRRVDYATLDQRSTRFAHALAAAGVGPGEHVGLYLHNQLEHLEAMLGCFKRRAVPINVNYRYGAEELAYLFADAELAALVYGSEYREMVAATRPRVAPTHSRNPMPLIEVGRAGETAPAGALAYEAALAAAPTTRAFGPRSADDHYVLYTGGTTGLPKGVVWRHEDILFATLGGGNPGGPPIEVPEDLAVTVVANRALRLGPFLPAGDPGPDRFVALALGPLMHASGQWSALGTLLAGGTVVLYTERSIDMARVLALIERERVVMLTLVGDASARPLLEARESHPTRDETSSLQLLGSGGAILSGDVKARLLAAFPSVVAITEAIGSSESPVQAVAVARRDGAPQQSLRFDPRENTMVVDDDLRPVAPGSGAIGRLATRGRVPLGYYRDAEKSAHTFVEIGGVRWALPGDMATVDADGSIHLLGRGSMCINTGGEKVYPEEVEAVVKEHPKVADAIVVGAPDDHRGQRVVVVAAATDPAAPPTLGEIQQQCRSRLAGYKIPRALVVADHVERSPAGKPDYRWAAEVAAGAPDSS